MKRVFAVNLLLFAGFGANVQADCVADGYEDRINGNAISVALGNKSIDANTPDGNENWKEDHCGASSGNLYKVGAGTPVDPRALRGTWRRQGNTVIYDYGTGGSYQWRLYQDANGDVAAGALCWQENMNDGEVIAKSTTAPTLPTGPCP